MKMKDGFVLRELAGQYVVIATGEASKYFHGMVKLNQVGGEIWKGLEKGKTKEEVAREIANRYEVSEEKSLQDVEGLINQMKEEGFFE